MNETLELRYSSESTQQRLFNESQHDSIKMFFKNRCIFVLWIRAASALEGLKLLSGLYSWKGYISVCHNKAFITIIPHLFDRSFNLNITPSGNAACAIKLNCIRL